MNKPSILLFGAGGHARACIDVIEQENNFSIAGIIGLHDEVAKNILGYSVLGSNEDIDVFTSKYKNALIVVGQIKSAEIRIRLYEELKKRDCILPTIISPYSYISKHAQIGEGSIIMHGAIVNAGASVGNNCIINSKALVEHDSLISDHCHISTSAVVNGGVIIGSGTFIGSNSSIREGTVIEEASVIGLGEKVLFDYSADSMFQK